MTNNRLTKAIRWTLQTFHLSLNCWFEQLNIKYSEAAICLTFTWEKKRFWYDVQLQAYECLADEVRRRAFNSLREEKFCSECYSKSLSKRDSNSEKQRTGVQTKIRRALMALKETKKRLQEECRVIETCLNTNRPRAGNVSPLFDPSAHLLNNGYPHYRDRPFAAPDEHEQYRSSDDKNHRRKGKCESPIYEIRKEQKPNKPKSYGFRLWVSNTAHDHASYLIIWRLQQNCWCDK